MFNNDDNIKKKKVLCYVIRKTVKIKALCRENVGW